MIRSLWLVALIFAAVSLDGQTPSPARAARAQALLLHVSDETGLVIGADWPETIPICVERPEPVSSGVGYWCETVGNLRIRMRAPH